MINRSEQINELVAALAKAQGQIKGALKDAENPHFKSDYATLDSAWDACRAPLSSNGLSVIQSPCVTAAGSVQIVTLLAHSSGQWMESVLELVPVNRTPQSIGSAITYGRRYALMGMVGIAPRDDEENKEKDDDGNAANSETPSVPSTGLPKPKERPPQSNTLPRPGKPSMAQISRMWTIMTANGVPKDHLSAHMLSKFGRASSKDLLLAEYDAVVRDIEEGRVPELKQNG